MAKKYPLVIQTQEHRTFTQITQQTIIGTCQDQVHARIRMTMLLLPYTSYRQEFSTLHQPMIIVNRTIEA